MHICFLCSEYPAPGRMHGGLGTFVQTLGLALVSAGHKVTVLGINDHPVFEEYKDEGISVIRLKPGFIPGLRWWQNIQAINRKLSEIHQKDKLDIIEATEAGLFCIRKISGIKYLIRCHGGHHFFSVVERKRRNLRKAFREKRSFIRADKVIAVSSYVMDETASYLSFKDKAGPVIYNPANFSRFYEADPAKVVPGRIFFSGTICEKKGIRQLVMAMPKILEAIPEAHLQIAGRDWFFSDGKSYTTYLKTFIYPEIISKIEFLGYLDNKDIPSKIETAELCVHPSHMEAMPIGWIEVLSMGKAVVGSTLGPGPEVLCNEKNGLLCNPMDPDDIADKVIRLLKDKKLSLKLGKEARKDALERFHLDAILPQNLDFYRQLIVE